MKVALQSNAVNLFDEIPDPKRNKTKDAVMKVLFLLHITSLALLPLLACGWVLSGCIKDWHGCILLPCFPKTKMTLALKYFVYKEVKWLHYTYSGFSHARSTCSSYPNGVLILKCYAMIDRVVLWTYKIYLCGVLIFGLRFPISGFIAVLQSADLLVKYVFFVMQSYLPEVWGISFTHAAAILNIWGGISKLMQCFCLSMVDEFLGHFGMLVLSTISYSVGTAFVAMSGPPVLASITGTCKQYEPGCIGSTQKTLFYIGMVLIAVGMSGSKVSAVLFLHSQLEQARGDVNGELNRVVRIFYYVVAVGVPVSVTLVTPYIKSWTIRFAIPAISIAICMFLFLSHSLAYEKSLGVTRSPLTNLFRVFVVSATKMRESFPLSSEFYNQSCDQSPVNFPRDRCFRFLEKAAINSNPGCPVKNKWKVCTVQEVEEAKTILRMIPMWMTLIVCGIVSSFRNTYFVEQASHLDRKIGKWNLPIQMFLLFSQGASYICSMIANALAKRFLFKRERRFATHAGEPIYHNVPRKGKRPAVGIGIAMIFSTLCCITAARTEEMRLGVIRRHDLSEKPEDDVPMGIYWLLFQFFLLAVLDAFLNKSLVAFYMHQSPESMKPYLEHLTAGVSGLGYMSSVFSVYVVGRISARGGRPNWFQFTPNKSRLDKYYWVLACVSALNFVVFVVVAMFYRYREYTEVMEDMEPEEIL